MKTSQQLKKEFIAQEVTIVNSENKKNIGLKGKIIDETKNTFLIKTSNGIKRVIKRQNTFEFAADGTKIVVDGKKIAKRPEERIRL